MATKDAWSNKVFRDVWPLSKGYSLPMKAIAIGDRASGRELRGHENILVRDGRLPVQWFFESNPKPKKFSGRIYLHEELRIAIPKAWANHVGNYRITSRPHEEITEIVIVGLLGEFYSSSESIRSALNRAKDLVGNFTGLKKTFLLEIRHKNSNHDNDALVLKCMFELTKELGAGGRVITMSDFLIRDSFRGCLIVDIGNHLLWSDNHLVHVALGRGAVVAASDSAWPKKGVRSIPLSPFHQLLLREQGQSASLIGIPGLRHRQILKKLEHSMPNRPQAPYPWPNWFTVWAKI